MTTFYHNLCPLCGSQKELLYELDHATIVRCKNRGCRLIFTESQPSDDKLSEYYSELYYPKDDDTSFVSKPNSDATKFRQHIAFLNQKIDLQGKNILDYGCGEGNFLEVGRETGANNLWGIELNDRARQIAVKKGFTVEASTTCFAPNSIDVVYMNDVVEHLRDPVGELKKIHALLAPGGALFIITMNTKGLKALILGKKWDLITDPTHLYFYNRSSLKNTLYFAKFQYVEEAKFEVKFSHHSPVRQILQKLLVLTSLDAGLKFLAIKALNC